MAVHPEIDVLQAWSTGRLPDDAARVIEMHLTACNTCGDTLEGLQDARALFERIRNLRGQPQVPMEPAGTWLARLKQNRPGASDHDEILRRGHLGQYRILAKCGAGGMGAVYRATHPIMQREVAIKVLPRRLALDQLAYDRFLREVQLLARLDHPHIVRAHDAGIDAGVPYLVMEHVPGTNCDECVRQSGPLSLPTVCMLLEQIAAALQYAHEQRFVHRDIKPSNLLLNPEGTHVKLSDLGLARAGEAALGDSTVSGLTAEGLVMGTPDYLAPEQWQDARSADIRADLYGLGCTAYFLLTGQVSFPGSGDYREKMTRHCRGGATPVERLRPEIPAELASVIRRLMSPRREDRYQTPAELSEALRKLPSHQETIVRSAAPIPLTGRPMLWAAVIAPVIVVLAIVASHLHSTPHNESTETTENIAAVDAGAPLETPHAPIVEQPLEPDGRSNDIVPVPVRREGPPIPSEFPRFDPRMTALLDGNREELADEAMEGDVDERTPTLIRTFRGHTGEVTWVAFAPDGQSFASASFDRTLRVWSPHKDEPTAILRHPHQVMCAAFAPKGNSLVTCTDEEGAVRLWNVKAREATILGTQQGPWSMLRCVAYRDDGGLIASGSMAVASQSSVTLWDPSQKKSTALGPAGNRAYGGVNGLAFCPRSKLVAVGYDVPQGSGVRLWDTASGEELDFLAGPSIALAFSPNGKRLITAQGQEAILWSVDPQKKRAIKDTKFQVTAIPFGFPRFACTAAFASDNSTLAISYHDGTVALWNADTSDQIAEFKAHSVARNPVIHYRECSVAFAPDGKSLLTGGFDHQVKLWKLPADQKGERRTSVP